MLKGTAATALTSPEDAADRLSPVRAGVDQLDNLSCDALRGCGCWADSHLLTGQRSGHKYRPVSGLISDCVTGRAYAIAAPAYTRYLQLNIRRITRQPGPLLLAPAAAVLSTKSFHQLCPAGPSLRLLRALSYAGQILLPLRCISG